MGKASLGVLGTLNVLNQAKGLSNLALTRRVGCTPIRSMQQCQSPHQEKKRMSIGLVISEQHGHCHEVMGTISLEDDAEGPLYKAVAKVEATRVRVTRAQEGMVSKGV